MISQDCGRIPSAFQYKAKIIKSEWTGLDIAILSDLITRVVPAKLSWTASFPSDFPCDVDSRSSIL